MGPKDEAPNLKERNTMNTEAKRYIIQCTGTGMIDGRYCQDTYGSDDGLKALQGIAAYWESVTGHPMTIHLVTHDDVRGWPYLNDYYGPTAKYKRPVP